MTPNATTVADILSDLDHGIVRLQMMQVEKPYEMEKLIEFISEMKRAQKKAESFFALIGGYNT